MHEHWSGLLYGRTISPYLTRALLPTRVTPDAVTAAMWLSGVAAAAVLTIPSPAAALAAFALIQLQLVLDCADGELARWRQKTGSVRGVYIDAMGHVTTNAFLVAAVGVHADGGFGSIGGWTTLGLATGMLVLLVHAETDLVYVARAKAGMPLLEASATEPQVGLVRRLKRLLTRLPVNRLLTAWDLCFVVAVLAVAEWVSGSLRYFQGLAVALAAIGVYVVLGHLLSVLTSRRLS